jgi:Photoprotection regulator fluorescence recovery protein
MSGPSATPNKYPYPHEPTWSRSEKAIARAVFDAALKRELHEVMQETKQRATQIKEPADLWELESYLTQRRKEIDRKYDFRSSRLAPVFGRLLFEHRVSENELRGLGEDKRKAIHSCAKFLAEDAASPGF